MPYVFLAASIVSNFLGQILMKYAADRINFSGSFGVDLFKSMLVSPHLLAGAAFYFLGMIAWLLTLSKLELSFAYPFMAITYVLITLASFILFKESVTGLKIAGITLILLGILVLGMSLGQKG